MQRRSSGSGMRNFAEHGHAKRNQRIDDQYYGVHDISRDGSARAARDIAHSRRADGSYKAGMGDGGFGDAGGNACQQATASKSSYKVHDTAGRDGNWMRRGYKSNGPGPRHARGHLHIDTDGHFRDGVKCGVPFDGSDCSREVTGIHSRKTKNV